MAGVGISLIIVAVVLLFTPATRWVIAPGELHSDGDAWVAQLRVRERDVVHVKLRQTVRVILPTHADPLIGDVIAISDEITPYATGDGYCEVTVRMTHMPLMSDGKAPKQHTTVDASIDTGYTNWLYRLLSI